MNQIIIIGQMDNSDGTREQHNRVYSPEGLAPCLNTVQGGGKTPFILEVNQMETKYRIRRLTEKECLRLMGVSEEDAETICKTVSATQAYKQAGNSIVVDVMVAIFDNLFNDKDEMPGQMTIYDYL